MIKKSNLTMLNLSISIEKIRYIFPFLLFSIFYLLVGTSLSLGIGELLRWIGSLILALLGFSDKLITKSRFKVWPTYYTWLLVPTIFSLVLNSEVFWIGFFRFSSFILVIYALYSYNDRKNVTKKTLKSNFYIFAFILLFIMTLHFLLLISSPHEFGNFKGIYDNKNFLSTMAVFSVICTLSLSTKIKIIKYIMFILCSIIVLATGSRTGLICLLIIFMAIPFVYTSQKGVNNKILLFCELVFMLTLIILFLKYSKLDVIERLFAKSSLDGSTGISRNGVWDLAIPLFKQKPLFGWGNSSVYYHVNQGVSWGFHNSFLVILVENGIIGSLFYTIFFIRLIFYNFIRYRRLEFNKKDGIFIKCLFLIIFVLIINGMSESFLFAVGNPMSICFWLTAITLDKFLELRV